MMSSVSGVMFTRPGAAAKPCSLPIVADSTSSMQGSSCALSSMLKAPPPSVVTLPVLPPLHLMETTLLPTAAPVAAMPFKVKAGGSLVLQAAKKALTAIVATVASRNLNCCMKSPLV